MDVQRVQCQCPADHLLVSNNKPMFKMLDTSFIFGTEMLCKKVSEKASTWLPRTLIHLSSIFNPTPSAQSPEATTMHTLSSMHVHNGNGREHTGEATLFVFAGQALFARLEASLLQGATGQGDHLPHEMYHRKFIALKQGVSTFVLCAHPPTQSQTNRTMVPVQTRANISSRSPRTMFIITGMWVV